MSFSFPSEKVLHVLYMCSSALEKGHFILRVVASILGNFTWACPTITFTQWHYRSILKLYIKNAKSRSGDLNSIYVLNVEAKAYLSWWGKHLKSLFAVASHFEDHERRNRRCAILGSYSSFCEERNLGTEALHFTGTPNIMADIESRCTVDAGNFKFVSELARCILISGLVIKTCSVLHGIRSCLRSFHGELNLGRQFSTLSCSIWAL